MTPIEPFRIHVDDTVLEDLRIRLRHARLAPVLGADDSGYGLPTGQLQALVEYWRDGFDWRAQEAEFGRYAHYRTVIDSVPLHFLHERGTGPSPMPIILTHGWPWTFWDFRQLVDRLAHPVRHGGDPADSFDVVVPSLPGFGFSSPLPRAGITFSEIADLWAKLMTQLGYERFAAHGGDFGAFVTGELGHRHPERVIGAHLTTVVRLDAWTAERPWSDMVRRPLPDGDPMARQRVYERERKYAAHMTVQILEPQTLAHALHDSPAGLASWLVHRRQRWSDCGGDVERRFSRDDLLTTVMLFWVTNTLASSTRYYHHMAHSTWEPVSDATPVVPVPTGFVVFERDQLPGFDISAMSSHFNIQHVSKSAVGGHFGAAEEPDIVAESLRSMFRELR
jgi:pimeloyl-ACP methyl ester carboxylesterase